MAEKILFCISAAQTVVAHWRDGRILQCQAFTNDDAGVTAFAGSLDNARPALVHIAVDTVEEDYRFETLPHATGSDRVQLLDRKLKQCYRNSPYVSAMARGRDGGERRDDRYLLSALTNPGLIDPWLRVVNMRGLPVAGIHLVPMLTAALTAKLHISAPNVLVAAPHSAGLRLTIYRGGEFCLSRLTRGNPSTSEDPAKLFTDEITNTRAYLSSLLPDAADEALTVAFLDRYDELGAIVGNIAAENPNLDCVHVNRAALTQHLGIDAQHLDVALETIYLPLLAANPPIANLAPTPITAGYRHYQRTRAIYASAAIVALSGMVWSGFNLWQTHDLEQQIGATARQTATAHAQYRDITRQFPAAPASSENLVKAVEIHQKLVKSARYPSMLMHVVSRAVEQSPDIFLQELGWAYGIGRVEPAGATLSAATAPADAAGNRVQSGYVSGEIRPFLGDYRTAVETINRFANRLARDPLVASVQIVKQPLNVNPGLALSGNTRDAAEHRGSADFKLVLTLKPDA